MNAARTTALVLYLLVQVAGCGPSFDGRVYDGHGVRFATGSPAEGWRRIDVGGALLAFRDDGQDATVAVNARCGRDADDAPLQALTQHLFLLFTERKIDEQKLVSMDGREALRTTLTAKLDGVQKAFAVYVLKKDGCVYDCMYISAPETFPAGVKRFDEFVGGFHTQTDATGGR
jgi:hypothetical protein